MGCYYLCEDKYQNEFVKVPLSKDMTEIISHGFSYSDKVLELIDKLTNVWCKIDPGLPSFLSD